MGSKPTLTDQLWQLIREELERHRARTDADDGLKSISIIIPINERGRRPVRILFRTESQREVNHDRGSS